MAQRGTTFVLSINRVDKCQLHASRYTKQSLMMIAALKTDRWGKNTQRGDAKDGVRVTAARPLTSSFLSAGRVSPTFAASSGRLWFVHVELAPVDGPVLAVSSLEPVVRLLEVAVPHEPARSTQRRRVL